METVRPCGLATGHFAQIACQKRPIAPLDYADFESHNLNEIVGIIEFNEPKPQGIPRLLRLAWRFAAGKESV